MITFDRLTSTAELDAILALDRVRVALAAAGAEPVGGSPEKADALIRAEVERFGAIVGK